jgi:hypothetical protein
MTSSPNNSLAFEIQENITFSKDQDQFLKQITDVYQKTARASNSKDVGTYELTELINGQKFFKTQGPSDAWGVKNQIYRKVIECGALPNAGTTTTAHGLTGVNNNWMFTRVYGVARDPANVIFITLPNSGAHQVDVFVDATNVYLTTVADLTAFSYSFVVLEYWKA